MASIRLENVSVAFPIYDASSRSLKKRLISRNLGGNTGGQIDAENAAQPSVIRSLEDVTLSFNHGDRVGLVGHNGAGKTTLLRVLSGIYEPALGRIEVEGSVAPLFDIALGMDLESTGYDNIYLRGLFLGLSKQQIADRTEEIARFTELGEFLEMPMRVYSAGMRMRLAFAVSTTIEPEILLLDEGIGAGDAAFLEKANQRLAEFTDNVSIIVLASHSDELIRRMCQVCVLMERGRIIEVGPTDEILSMYRERIKAQKQ